MTIAINQVSQKFQNFCANVGHGIASVPSRIKSALTPKPKDDVYGPSYTFLNKLNSSKPMAQISSRVKALCTAKGFVVGVGVSTVVGGSIAAGVLHAAWVPGLVVGLKAIGAAFVAVGAAIGAISPAGWAIIGVVGAIALGLAAYGLYKFVQNKRLASQKQALQSENSVLRVKLIQEMGLPPTLPRS